MLKLNTTQEIRIVQKILQTDSFIDAGSSRAVFSLSKTKVVKIAIDKEGIQQNLNEIKTFDVFGDDKLARIYAYGEYIIVMERVEHGFDSEDLEYCDEDYDLTEDDIEEIYKIAGFLDSKIGETIDNQQIGFSVERQKWVCYDYGLNLKDHCVSECVSTGLDYYLYKNGTNSVPNLILKNLATKLDIIAKI